MSDRKADGENTSKEPKKLITSTDRSSAAYPSSTTSSPLEPNLSNSPVTTDRVFPIRSVVTVDSTNTPAIRVENQDSYFHGANPSYSDRRPGPSHREKGRASESSNIISPGPSTTSYYGSSRSNRPKLPAQSISQIAAEALETKSIPEDASSIRSGKTGEYQNDPENDYVTTRFKHVITDDGHAIITGRDAELQRCEDEPIHIPGAIQSFGLLIALEEEDGKFVVRVVSENSFDVIGYTPQQLFKLENFVDILSEEQADNVLDHIDFVRDEDTDVERDGPELFTMTLKPDKRRAIKVWCAMHINPRHPNLIICEFELENDARNPLVHPDESTPDIPEDTLNSDPSTDEFSESTQTLSKPLRVLRSARKSRGEAAAMEVFNIMSQIQEQLAEAPTLDLFLKVLIGVVKELTGFHRVMIYQFDKSFNGRVVTELVDPRATKDLYKGLHFPASDIPRQARELYKINRVRLLYDREQETARLVCRTMEDLETPLDLTHSYLRAISPIHLKYLKNMAVRSSMSISINAFDELWGLISCHTYGVHGMRVAFPIRKMCRLVGDTASRNIERLSYASRLQARKLINTVPTQHNPSGYIIASSDDLLRLFNADFGALCIRDETKMLGNIQNLQETLAMLEYLKVRKMMSVTSSQDIKEDFPDLVYPPGFQVLAGMLLVPLTPTGSDFIAFFRRGQLREVKWAGNPYEKVIRDGTAAYLEPRKSFKLWSETVVGKCREWTEEEVETAAVLCLVYGKFIEVWRQKEAALQNSQLTKLLIANSAHEVRTPLNAIINYLEIALENLGTEGILDTETRDYLTKSHSASKSLIYVINDLLDLTKTEQGIDLVKSERMPLAPTFQEATDQFKENAKRKGIDYKVTLHPGLPKTVLGDQRKIRQAISNIIANAVKYTTTGGVTIDVYVTSVEQHFVHVEVVVEDTGVGMSQKRLDTLFMHLEQIQSDSESALTTPNTKSPTEEPSIGLGLAVVARIVRNMNGQLRLKSEEGQGSRFVVQLPFEMPNEELNRQEKEESPPNTIKPVPVAQEKNEVLLVDRTRELQRSRNASPERLARRASSGSNRSKKSMSIKSATGSLGSHASGKSDVDRLIEAIQVPHLVDTKRMSGSALLPQRPTLEKTRTLTEDPSSFRRFRSPSFGETSSAATSIPGQQSILGSLMPLKPVKVPDDEGVSMSAYGKYNTPGQVTGEVSEQLDDKKMNVLVAEDDPVNSKIIHKRLERAGHLATMTVNGEECASRYEVQERFFDVVLMDMQMPIVDGLTATQMIRKIEQSKSQACLSPRAALNGRVPIIAVSASLVESERQTYIDAGFDAWILKPISFVRLAELMTGIVEPTVRESSVYKPGQWEKGGWFEKAKPSETKTHVDGMKEAKNLPEYTQAVSKSHSAPALRPSQLDDMAESETLQNITGEDPIQSPEATDQ